MSALREFNGPASASASAENAEPLAAQVARRRVGRRMRPLKQRTHASLRWLHTYTSMISLLVVLFFALTGITLNHPDWAFGSQETRREVKGTLPAAWIQAGEVNWLLVAEELRAQQGLKGRVGETRIDDKEATISFAAPGYSADAFINTSTGAYTANILAQGSVAVLNDLHKGRDAGGAWRWVIDVSAAFLVLVAATGLGILLYLKKTRKQALTVMGFAGMLVLLLGKMATG